MTAARVITQQEFAEGVARRLLATVGGGRHWRAGWRESLQSKLDAGGLTISDLNESTGLRYSLLGCTQCGATPSALAEVGDLPDYESSTATLCEACLVAALDALRAKLAGGDRAGAAS